MCDKLTKQTLLSPGDINKKCNHCLQFKVMEPLAVICNVCHFQPQFAKMLYFTAFCDGFKKRPTFMLPIMLKFCFEKKKHAGKTVALNFLVFFEK